jgi:membrane protease YdiL (CAAX protease family)
MFLFDLPIVAQVNPEDLKISAGQAVAALLTLAMLLASLCMIGVWIMRYLRHDYCLPAADRGILRCPVPLTTVAVVLTGLMGILGLLSSLSPDELPRRGDSEVVVVPENGMSSHLEATSVIRDEGAESAQSTDESSEANRTDADAPDTVVPPGELQKKFVKGIQFTLILDLIFIAMFGTVIWLNRSRGLASIPASSRRSALNHSGMAVAETAVDSSSAFTMWPDLDAPVVAVTPQVNTPTDAESATEPQSGDSHRAAEAIPVDTGNPYASVTEMPQSTDPSDTVPVESESEPLSWIVELRFAFEVFVVAVLPTTCLRLLIVVLYSEFTGTDEIPQHPFLELMQDGVGVQTLLMIGFMAIVMAPLMEELLYRVVILGGFAQQGYATLGLYASSILFGLAHGFPDCLALLPLAFLLGYTYLRRRSYIAVILVHFLFNAFNLLVAGMGLL